MNVTIACKCCGKETPHERRIVKSPWGHLIMLVLTGGLWFFVIPWAILFTDVQPKCKICGMQNNMLRSKGAREWKEFFVEGFSTAFRRWR